MPAVLNQQAAIAEMQKDYVRAEQLAMESFRLFREAGIDWGIAMAYSMLSWVAISRGQNQEARRWALEGLHIVLKYRLWRHAQFILDTVAEIYLWEGHTERSYELLGVLDQQRLKMGQAKDAWSLASEIDLEINLPPNMRAAVERGRAKDYEVALRETIQELSQGTPAPEHSNGHSHPALLDALSERELEILRLVSQGFSNREIADQMVIALGTVKTHVHNIYSKLGVESRTQAIARARDLNLI
jgi:ATP/maltotriose-dependent transcriptional regulator MalT